jgi:hypothetical protein
LRKLLRDDQKDETEEVDEIEERKSLINDGVLYKRVGQASAEKW